jgi:hypothetical protein
MLETIDGKPITRVPHAEEFQALVRRLGDERVLAVREGLDAIVDRHPVERNSGTRTISSSILGSKLSPWPYPLRHLHDLAIELEGEPADRPEVEQRAALIFGLFLFECMIHRPERWGFYDPNMSSRDPNREITGKVYFER